MASPSQRETLHRLRAFVVADRQLNRDDNGHWPPRQATAATALGKRNNGRSRSKAGTDLPVGSGLHTPQAVVAGSAMREEEGSRSKRRRLRSSRITNSGSSSAFSRSSEVASGLRVVHSRCVIPLFAKSTAVLPLVLFLLVSSSARCSLPLGTVQEAHRFLL